VRELSPNHCSNLRHFFRRAKPVEPRHQRGVQGHRDSNRRGRNGCSRALRITVASPLPARPSSFPQRTAPQQQFEFFFPTDKLGQAACVHGLEAGIGKSRLTAVLLERIATEPHTRLRYFCSPQHTDSALYPIISQMERAAGFAHDDTAQAKLDKLDALLAQSFTPRQDAALLAEMLSLANDGRYPTLELAPQQKRQNMLEALMAQLQALSQSKPVLMIFEDVHWTDPTSLETLVKGKNRRRASDIAVR
jgi:hypothetical protein